MFRILFRCRNTYRHPQLRSLSARDRIALPVRFLHSSNACFWQNFLQGVEVMSLHIIKSDRRKEEERIGRYMQEIRDIVAARLSRRELLRMGLVMGGAGLLALHGTRNFRPYWAHADDDHDLRLTSPPNTPFVDPLPIPPVLQQTTLNPAPTFGTNPTAVPGARPVIGGFTEAARDAHQ